MKKIFYFLITIVFSVSCFSCKKKNAKTNETQTSQTTTTPTSTIILQETKANGFIVFKKYYTILNSTVTYDSSANHIGIIMPSFLINYQEAFYNIPDMGGLGGIPYNYIRVNGQNYIDYYPNGFDDPSKANVIHPRHVEFSPICCYDTLNFNDNTLLPNLTNVNGIPDSVKFNTTLNFNIGTRTNTMESELFFGFWGSINYVWSIIPNSQATINVPYYNMLDASAGTYAVFQYSLRNWSFTIVNNNKYCVVCEHIYSKKIKLYH